MARNFAGAIDRRFPSHRPSRPMAIDYLRKRNGDNSLDDVFKYLDGYTETVPGGDDLPVDEKLQILLDGDAEKIQELMEEGDLEAKQDFEPIPISGTGKKKHQHRPIRQAVRGLHILLQPETYRPSGNANDESADDSAEGER